jgi:DNA polymerase-3 subunit alpha
LLSVELDRRAGDETPRVTIKRFQPLSDLAKRTRLQMTVRVPDGGVAARVAMEFDDARGSNGLLRFLVPMASGGEAIVVAGRDFALDAELAARVERISGEGSVDLSAQEPPKLALVG